MRNTRVTDIAYALNEYSIGVDVYDPWVSEGASSSMSEISLVEEALPGAYDAVIVAVKHQVFIDMGISKIREFCKSGGVVYDLKSAFDKSATDKRL